MNSNTQDKRFSDNYHSKTSRGCNTVRSRCIQYVQTLNAQGYECLPLSEAKRTFSMTLGIFDQKSVKAYFGTQKHVARHSVERFARYASGIAAIKRIELTQQVEHQIGYLETLGLVTYEMRGKVWFMTLKTAILVPLLMKSGDESMRNFSLSTITDPIHSEALSERSEHVAEAAARDLPRRNNDDTTTTNIHTLLSGRERNLASKHIEAYSLSPDPVSLEPKPEEQQLLRVLEADRILRKMKEGS